MTSPPPFSPDGLWRFQSREVHSAAVVPIDLGERIEASYSRLLEHGPVAGLERVVFAGGHLHFYWADDSAARWFCLDARELIEPLSWEAFKLVIGQLCSLSLAHGTVDLRTLQRDGSLVGHHIGLVALAAASGPQDAPWGLMTDDPRFAAPESWFGGPPSPGSDVFAATAAYCWLRRPLAPHLFRSRASALTVSPRGRVAMNDPPEQQSILLSLLDVDPGVRLHVVWELEKWP